jgi:hypothetical protein
MKLILIVIALLFYSHGFTQSANPPGLSLIRTDELKKDLYDLADAHFRGRSAGTIDELKASAWLAEKYRAIGLKPAGDNGTYLQFFTMWRNVISEKSSLQLNNAPQRIWQDVMVAQMAHTQLNDTVVYLGNARDLDTSKLNVSGRLVALEANAKDINLDVSLPTWRYNRYIYTKYGLPLLRRGVKGIIFLADDVAEKAWDDAAENYKRGSYDIEGGPAATLTITLPVFWLHQTAKAALQNSRAVFTANLVVNRYPYPSVNIVGKIDGTDAKLKSEYLLFSGHQDAHGVRNAVNGDSVYYGADDNGSVDVAMLANARAFVKFPPKRSVLFIIHGAEERGLLGSRYYSSHPTVPIDQIVAVLNGDMIGRNHPDSAAVLGVQPPHRNSPDLVAMVLAANREGPAFKLDTSWDKATHVEGWYFRSDHLPYARLGIPSLMYTTLLHPDYHTPGDNAQNINYSKLKKMADWMYRTGYKVANAPQRPNREPGFKLER